MDGLGRHFLEIADNNFFDNGDITDGFLIKRNIRISS
jgi:hypothetical protein